MSPSLSASQLNNFLGCQHYTALWLADIKPPDQVDASTELIQKKGIEHEERVLTRLESLHGTAVRIEGHAVAFQARVNATVTAIRAGAPLIYQGALHSDRWVGFPDFLVRKEQNADGSWQYAPEDAKLKFSTTASHVLQLNVYAQLLDATAAVHATHGTIYMGSGEPETFDLRKTTHVTTRLMRRLEAFVDLPTRHTQPRRVAACKHCPYRERCEGEWRAADSPIFVANITANQVDALANVQITTLELLAASDPNVPIDGIGRETMVRIQRQARLQASARRAPPDAHGGRAEQVEVLPAIRGRGFTVLPPVDAGDLFFDMEGDPHYPAGLQRPDGPLCKPGLEYLFGLWGQVGLQGANEYRAFWGLDRAKELAAFTSVMRFFMAHLAKYPAAHIYHYNSYEVSALKRISNLNKLFMPELDQMLREQRFVDLYPIVRQALCVSTEQYSLKALEKIYWPHRTGDVSNAGDSVVQFEAWLRDPSNQKILDDIAIYNKEDCVSTQELRQWLVAQRPASAGYQLTRELAEKEADKLARAAAGAEEQAAREALAAKLKTNGALSVQAANLLSELLWFHERALKPEWWQYFSWPMHTEEELIDSFDCIGGMTLDTSVALVIEKQSHIATYRFAAQETKRKVGEQVLFSDTLESAGTIQSLDKDCGVLTLKRAINKGAFPGTASIVPSEIFVPKKQIAAVRALVERVANGDLSSDRATLDLLEKRLPRFKGRLAGQPVIPLGAPLTDATVQAVLDLDESYLPIQGPPGTGKTHTTACAILALLKAGKRVAVSSNSHRVIDHVLNEVERMALAAGQVFKGAKYGQKPTGCQGGLIENVTQERSLTAQHRLVGATAFVLSRTEQVGCYDYLIIDEAGQVALANVVAMAACARNLVLVGDQRQLPQPTQGIHPEPSGFSCLDFLMEGHATVPPERGVLLDVSWRMHPDVCGFISDFIYDGRLQSHAQAKRRHLILQGAVSPALKATGLSVLLVDHSGCAQTSLPEARAIEQLIAELLNQQFVDEHGVTKPLTLAEIIVVAPFNAQVQLLQKVLPPGTEIGTVDKFQGQQAIVSIVSMTTSHGDDAPRGSAFLFSTERLNVALSRAKCLSILVRSRTLLDGTPSSVLDLERLDVFSALDMRAGV